MPRLSKQTIEKAKDKKQTKTDAFKLKSFNKVLGNVIVENLLPADLEAFRAKRKAEGLAPKTRDDQLKVAKKGVKKAYQNKKVGRDVLEVFEADMTECKRGSNARKKVLSPEQFRLLLEELPTHQKQIAATAFYTGMRKEEILGLTWDRVDLEGRRIRLDAEHTKDGEARNVPILEPLRGILEAIPKNHDYVFTYKGHRLFDLRTGFRAACEKAGIVYGRKPKDGFTFHDFRHTFNTYMRKAGVARHVIMEITGHSTDEMFRRYDTIDQDDKQAAAKRLEDFLANAYQNAYQTPKEASASGEYLQ